MRRLAVLAALSVPLGLVPLAGAETRTVRIGGGGFSPRTITVDLDDTVRWRNVDTGAHQVVAESGAFASPIIRRGQNWSFTFSEVGRYPYRDALYPARRGVVVVRAPAPAISVAANPGVLEYGEVATIGGTISNRRSGERVELLAQRHDSALPVSLGVVATTAGGAFGFTHRPSILTTYTVRWGATSSQPVAVGVRPDITFRRTTSRKRFVIRVKAERSFAGRRVYLQRRGLDQWVNVRRVRLGPKSGKIFDLPKRAGRYRVFMSVNQAGSGYLASWSGVQRIRRS